MLLPCSSFEVIAAQRRFSFLSSHWMCLASILVPVPDHQLLAELTANGPATAVLQAYLSCLNLGHLWSTVLFRVPEKDMSNMSYSFQWHFAVCKQLILKLILCSVEDATFWLSRYNNAETAKGPIENVDSCPDLPMLHLWWAYSKGLGFNDWLLLG